MLTANIDTQDRLINGLTWNSDHNKFAQGSLYKAYIIFSGKQAGLKTIRSSYLGRQNSWVTIEKCETAIPIKRSSTSQFPLTLAWTSTVYKP